MKLLRQIVIIFGICLISEGLCFLLPFSVPGSLVSMLLIFALLFTGVLKEEHIKETADFLIKILAFTFGPMGVGAVMELSANQNKLLAVILTILLTALITFLSGYFVAILVIKIQNKIRGGG